MDKALNYMALARKAGLIELGEEPVGAAARARHARLVVAAADAADHTWRRAKSFVSGTEQQCIRAPFTKEEMGMAVGRTSLALAAFTDGAMALAFLKALPDSQKFQQEMDRLAIKNQRIQQRRQEAKAHKRNQKTGRSRVRHGNKED